ncbi:YuiB family protein [Bacillus testis]|uniref:YuiB family protein n=1 Tax=Bacillus testis TaxID=1622072 RepID=UPI00067EC772|nr:YuiB family protein [Bacillus testis]
MPLTVPTLILSIILFFVLFFGIGFLLNMLFRASWIMAILFPLVALYMINNIKLIHYVTQPGSAFSHLGDRLAGIAVPDILVLGCGFLGAVASGFTMKTLRKKGYQMF